jgi:hypothetical protein
LPGTFDPPPALASLLPDAVAAAGQYMSQRRRDFDQNLRDRLDKEIRRLAHLRERQQMVLDLDMPEGDHLIGALRSRKEQRRRRIEEVFRSYQNWAEETLTTENQPFLRVAAVFVG